MTQFTNYIYQISYFRLLYTKFSEIWTSAACQNPQKQSDQGLSYLLFWQPICEFLPRTLYKPTGRGSVLALFQSTTANKIDSEHTWDYTKLFPVCKVEILHVTANKIEVISSF